MECVRPLVPFLGSPVVEDLSSFTADAAFLGVPYGSPYDMRGVHSLASDGPEAVRRVVHELEYAEELDHYDFDCDAPLLPAGRRLVDCGDVRADPRDLEGSRCAATAAVRSVVRAGALPLIVGGDDAIPPIVAAGLAELGRLHVLHIDAHVDFREEIFDVRDGYSSPIRRVRELPFIDQIVQVGLRGVGSARRAEVDAARAAGNRLVTMQELHAVGAQSIFLELADDAPWFVTIDCDGLDPSVAPGVSYPEPDGLSYAQAALFVRGLAGAGRLAAIEFTEYVPTLDVRSLTGLAIGRLLMNVVTLMPSRRAAPPTLALESLDA